MRTVSGCAAQRGPRRVGVGGAELAGFGRSLGLAERVVADRVEPRIGDRQPGVGGDLVAGRAQGQRPACRRARPADPAGRRSAARSRRTGARRPDSCPGWSACPTSRWPRRSHGTMPLLIRSWTSTPRGHTVIRLVMGLAPHQRSLATSTTAPWGSTESILYGPADGNRLSASPFMPGLRSQVVFQASAMRWTAAGSPLCSAWVTSTPSASAMTCDGIIDVAVNSCR